MKCHSTGFYECSQVSWVANRNESLRVAYVDEVNVETGPQAKTTSYYSKLVKVDKMDKTKDQVRSIFIVLHILDAVDSHH